MRLVKVLMRWGGMAQVLSFIDLAGHERYLKTTMFGLTGCSPDYCMLMGEHSRFKLVYLSPATSDGLDPFLIQSEETLV
jgi:hypothetical protein